MVAHQHAEQYEQREQQQEQRHERAIVDLKRKIGSQQSLIATLQQNAKDDAQLLKNSISDLKAQSQQRLEHECSLNSTIKAIKKDESGRGQCAGSATADARGC